ncbi:hypothetical protein B296_00015460 [Ensete ventricosum]|uniref:Uncharacterized protein n=1 Tax=Ensete ventricosum TaxID=4639 RepID=A0A427B4H5_ENSVE|nr:hypothetical protein B296_00015460 [Ensete ventricosum]
MSPPLDRLPTVPCSTAAAPRQHAVRRNPLSSVQLLLLHGSESRRSARHSSQSPLCLNHQGLDLLLEPLQVLDDQDRGGDSGLPNDRILGHVVLVQEPQLGLSILKLRGSRRLACGWTTSPTATPRLITAQIPPCFSSTLASAATFSHCHPLCASVSKPRVATCTLCASSRTPSIDDLRS